MRLSYEPFHSYSNPYVLTLVSLRLLWLMRAYHDDMHIKPNCNFSDGLTYRNDSQVVVERPESFPPLILAHSPTSAQGPYRRMTPYFVPATGLSLRGKKALNLYALNTHCPPSHATTLVMNASSSIHRPRSRRHSSVWRSE
jgi:hypothetical protein